MDEFYTRSTGMWREQTGKVEQTGVDINVFHLGVESSAVQSVDNVEARQLRNASRIARFSAANDSARALSLAAGDLYNITELSSKPVH